MIYKFALIVKRDIVNLIKNPTLLLSNTAFPIILILILSFLGRGEYGNTGVDSYDYYGITMIIYMILNVAMTAATALWRKESKVVISEFYIPPYQNGLSIYQKYVLPLFLLPCVFL